MDLATVKKTVESVFKVRLNTKTRRRRHVSARAAYGKLAREFTDSSLEEIGDFIKKDHATVLHYLRKYAWWPGDEDLYNRCFGILESIEATEEADLLNFIDLTNKYFELKQKYKELKRVQFDDAETCLIKIFRQLPADKKADVLSRTNATLKLSESEAA